MQLPLGTLCDSIVPAASQLVQDRQGILQLLKYHLSQAQHKMKENADKHRTEREFQVGDLVYIKLQPYRQNSVAVRRSLKLSSKFFGPFPILERVGKVAYRLLLPVGSRIHPVFHISKLKKHLGEAQQVQSTLPVLDDEDEVLIHPAEAVLQQRVIWRNNQHVQQLLVRWINLSPEEATWEDRDFIAAQFPEFTLPHP